jgi:hypothetical protein
MKIPKLALVIGAAVLVLAIALGFHFYMGSRIATAVANERVRAAQAEVALVSAQLQASHVINSQYEASLEAARQDSLAREKWFQSQIAHVQTASPAELVDQGSQILGVSDIKSDGVTVQMPVETYRKIVFILVDRQEYMNVREPAWKEREALYQKDIAQYKANEILYDRRDALNNNIISDLRVVISKHKTTTFFGKVAWAAAGFGAGVLANKLI